VNPVSLAGGFVLPGSRVDLIGTSVGASGEVTADTFMQNMLVLAIDTRINRDDSQTMLGNTVTFACTLEESMRLSVANKALDIRLVLRSPADKEKQTLPVVKIGDLHRPLTDQRKDEGDSADTTAGGALLVRNKKPMVEELTALPQQDEHDSVQVATQTPAPAASPPPAETFTMSITNGFNTIKSVYVKQQNGGWGSNKDGD
jgi:Flp pilus assembly protein CpaB